MWAQPWQLMLEGREGWLQSLQFPGRFLKKELQWSVSPSMAFLFWN
jgi:hypothetical protein